MSLLNFPPGSVICLFNKMQKAYVNQATPVSHLQPLICWWLGSFLMPTMKIFDSKYHCHYIYFCIYTEAWTLRIGKFTQEWQSRRKWTRDFTEFLTLLRYSKCGRRISDFAWKQSTSYSLHLLHYMIWSNIAEHSVLWTSRVLVTTCREKALCCSKIHYTHVNVEFLFSSVLYKV